MSEPFTTRRLLDGTPAVFMRPRNRLPADHVSTGTLKVDSITMRRVEGTGAELGRVTECLTWRFASNLLATWAETAPEPTKGSHSVEVTITWKDATKFAFTVELNRGHRKGCDLREATRQALMFLALQNDPLKHEPALRMLEHAQLRK